MEAKLAEFAPDDGIAFTPEEIRQHFAPINLGQLKATAKPLYDWINSVPGNAVPYSWTANPGDDANYAPAILGQLKNAFNFSTGSGGVVDGDGDGLPDGWEEQFVDADPNDAIGSVAGVNGGDDFDGDGITNQEEFENGTDPASYTETGLSYTYYETPSLAVLPDFDTLAPVKTGVVNNAKLTPRLRNNRFAFRFRGYLEIQTAGRYELFVTSDDGSALYLDGKLVIDNDGDHGSREIGGSIYLSEGRHEIDLRYFENNQEESLSWAWQGPDSGGLKVPIPDGVLHRQAGDDQGLYFEYYEIALDLLPDFDSLPPKQSGIADNFLLTPALRADRFGFRYRGYIEIPGTGTYTFTTISDDGSALYIDGQLVVNNDGRHAAREIGGSIQLSAGRHAIEVRYFDKTLEEILGVTWSGPRTGGKQPVPDLALRLTDGPLLDRDHDGFPISWKGSSLRLH